MTRPAGLCRQGAVKKKPMTSLKRITTEFIPVEDRIRLSGEREDNGSPLVLWLTQRLIRRMLPVLLDWLQKNETDLLEADSLHDLSRPADSATSDGLKKRKSGPASAGQTKGLGKAKAATPTTAADMKTLQGFAQEAARTQIPPQPPVKVDAITEEWLIQTIDVASNSQLIRLTFKAGAGKSVKLIFKAKQLRQWLSILHVGWLKGEWPLEPWPEWVGEHISSQRRAAVLH